jgi:recombination protein RecR
MLTAMTHKFPESLTALIAHLKKLPGVGLRTAERFAFEFLSWRKEDLAALAQSLNSLKEKIPPCATCGCLTEQGVCRFCDLASRDPSALCIIASPRDAYAIEETRTYKGLYHVVEHLLSPLDGRHAAGLRLDRITARLKEHPIRELILAFDSTLEGDTTALYLKNHLAQPLLSISRLAFGLPVGSSLEYIDGGTLARALAGRQKEF